MRTPITAKVRRILDTYGYAKVLRAMELIATQKHLDDDWKYPEIKAIHFENAKLFGRAAAEVEARNEEVKRVLWG